MAAKPWSSPEILRLDHTAKSSIVSSFKEAQGWSLGRRSLKIPIENQSSIFLVLTITPSHVRNQIDFLDWKHGCFRYHSSSKTQSTFIVSAQVLRHKAENLTWMQNLILVLWNKRKRLHTWFHLDIFNLTAFFDCMPVLVQNSIDELCNTSFPHSAEQIGQLAGTENNIRWMALNWFCGEKRPEFRN